MLTFSLDEYGDFEGLRKENAPVYIAGVIYDDGGDDRELGIELGRIKAYYKAVIRDAAAGASDTSAFTYPEALHSDGQASRDHTVVRPVKQQVNRTLADFIKYGTYEGARLEFTDQNGIAHLFTERTGRYYPFVMLKSDKGMTRLLGENVGILAKDDYASNLYFHMAGELVSRLVFYNPVIREMKEITLDIATRTSPNLAPDDPLVSEYRRLGYQPVKVNEKDPKSPVYFKLTNADIYRSVLSGEMLNSGKTHLKIRDFKVRSISYKAGASQKRMEFLYMADSLCSLLGFGLKQSGEGADAWLREIRERTGKLTGRKDDLIFGYDEINTVFARAWRFSEEGDLYKALSVSFDGKKAEGAFADLYREVWFEKLEERVLENRSLSDFNMAVRKLYETLNNNTLDQEKCLYILQVLERFIPEMERKFHSPEARRILYQFYDACVTACCHTGDSRRASAFFEKCRDYAELVSLEDYLNTRNKMAVYLCDDFDFRQALSMAEENLLYREYLNDMRAQIHLRASEAMDDPAMGKALSQLGQVQAFLRDPEAERTFRRALTFFERDSANYKITQSYLLHHLLDMGEWAAYESEAIAYFGDCAGTGRQLNYIINEGTKYDPLINIRFALYVFVRGLYTFRLSEVSDALWEKLQHIETVIGKKNGNRNYRLTGHPSELIFKYLRLIAISRGEDDAQRRLTERMHTCLGYSGPTEEVIVRFADVFCANAMGDRAARDQLSAALCSMMTEHFLALALENVPADGDRRYLWLNAHVTFMYR